MIQSMTGYGGARHVEDAAVYSLALKSVNHRFLKLSIKMPERLQFTESAVEKLLRSGIVRGSVSYALQVRHGGDAGTTPLNLPALQRYVDQITQVRVPSHVAATIDLGVVAGFPEVCKAAEADDEAQGVQLALVEDLTRRAIVALQQMRKEEGGALRRDLLEACASLRERLSEVAAQAPLVVQEYHKRLTARVQMLLEASQLELEGDALMREVAIYADRCDINEELARLASHLDQFVEVCDREEQVGRTLDFLTQEMLREANTIAAKSGDVAVSRNVVEMKRLIDRLREQVQNVE